MAKHTPGPWKVHTTLKNNVIESVSDEEYIGNVTYPNATLIAAAPELLEALRRMQQTHGMHGPWTDHSCRSCCEAYDMARAAIAKATK